MEVRSTTIEGLILVRPASLADARGLFCETWNRRDFAAAGITCDFVQDNQSLSREPRTLRGLHAQARPHEQAKLVRVLTGAIFDVGVDVRPGSPTFGRWFGAELSAENGWQMFLPHGFLHGFLTLAPDTRVAYKVDAYYARGSEIAVAWDDPALAIAWPLGGDAPVLSPKDAGAPSWASFLATL